MRTSTAAVAGGALLLAMTLAGCSTGGDTASPGSSDKTSGDASMAAEAALLAEHGLEGMDAVKIIDHLDRLGGADRPVDLTASVRPGELLMTGGSEEFSLEIPDDLFYLSTAPYVDETHDCFHHSLTTCKGELASVEIRVRIVDETNDEVLVDETTTTFENGFVGYWLPRDIEGSVHVTYDGKVGEVHFATDAAAPTCVSTLRLG